MLRFYLSDLLLGAASLSSMGGVGFGRFIWRKTFTFLWPDLRKWFFSIRRLSLAYLVNVLQVFSASELIYFQLMALSP